MEGYKEYKNSNINCFEEVPSNWEVVPMKFFLKYEKGKNAAKYTKEFLEDNSNGKYPVYSGQTSNNGILGFINEWDYDLRGIIVSTVGAKAMSIKIVDNKFALSQNCALISVKKDFNIDYSYYILKILFDYEKNKLANIMIPSLRFEDLDTYKIIKPSLEEQQKIAAYLDYKTATIDEIIAKKQKLIAALDEKKKSIINDIVTGKKVWNGFEFITPTQVKDSGIQWLGNIPEHWEVYKLKYLIQNISSGCSVNSEDSPITNDQEYGVLKTSCVYNYIFNSNENKKVLKEEYSRVKCPVKKNTIIVSRMNTPELVGASGYIDKDYNNLFLPDRLWQLNFKNDYYNSVRYISFILSSEIYRYQFGKISSGSSASMQNMSQSSFLNLEIVLPSENEIKSIEIELMKLFEILDLIKSKINTQIEKITEYRQAVIAEAVTGKIDVRHWTKPNN